MASDRTESRPLGCVILAAGEGTRMKSRRPKVSHELAGIPLVVHVLKAALPLRPDKIVVVVPPGDRLVSGLVGDRAVCVPQPELLGTGHALLQAGREFAGLAGDLLVLCGDAPLVTTPTLRRLLGFHRAGDFACSILTARLEDPSGYGRILRKGSGRVWKIVEDSDADVYQKAVDEVNSGMYCFRSPEIWEILERLKTDNRQEEYYLTDAVHLLVEAGRPVDALPADDPDEALGINTRADLSRAEKILQERQVRRHQDNGVTVICPPLTYIGAGVEIGQDAIIFPFTQIDPGVRVGRGCRVGPFVHLQPPASIPDGAEVKGKINLNDE